MAIESKSVFGHGCFLYCSYQAGESKVSTYPCRNPLSVAVWRHVAVGHCAKRWRVVAKTYFPYLQFPYSKSPWYVSESNLRQWIHASQSCEVPEPSQDVVAEAGSRSMHQLWLRLSSILMRLSVRCAMCKRLNIVDEASMHYGVAT